MKVGPKSSFRPFLHRALHMSSSASYSLPTFRSEAKTCQLSLLRPPLTFAMCFLFFVSFFFLLGSSSGCVLLYP